MKAVRLRTEYLRKPIGIDIRNPRLFWNCEGGVKQTAYQIIARVNGETVWNSGKVEAAAMTHPYEGRALRCAKDTEEHNFRRAVREAHKGRNARV